MIQDYEEYKYDQEKAWEAEQEYLASEDAKALADLEAKEQKER